MQCFTAYIQVTATVFEPSVTVDKMCCLKKRFYLLYEH